MKLRIKRHLFAEFVLRTAKLEYNTNNFVKTVRLKSYV